ncbi:MAG: CRISPR-associated protein Csx20 [Treponema sp.]|nr:CRISPR-associated protein Csx20 [Treponema sp.]
MPKTYCLLNHSLTQNQLAELKERFGAEEIIYPSDELSKSWSQIPPTEELDMSVINSALAWLSDAKENDILIVQGEFGSTFMLVDYALKKNLVPLYAVAKRVSKEVRVGEQVQKMNVFEHVCFRKYRFFE